MLSSESLYAVNGCILQNIVFIGINALERTLYHEGGLVESAQYEFELAGVGVDVANGIDPGDVGAVVEGVDLDGGFVDIQTPVGDRAQFGR